MYLERLAEDMRRERQPAAQPAGGVPGLSEEDRRIPGAVAAAKAMQAARDPSSGDFDSFRHLGIPTRRIQAVS